MANQNLCALLLVAALLPLAAASGRMLRGSPGYSNDIGEIFDCVFSVGPFDCNTAKGDADTASARAEALAPAVWSTASLHNGKGDAFRHCFWNALMARSIGADQAKEVADGHEGASPSPAAEKDMDFYNNGRGRAIGSDASSDAAAEEGCKDAALSGSLKTCCGF